jgi:hypothetical protein
MNRRITQGGVVRPVTRVKLQAPPAVTITTSNSSTTTVKTRSHAGLGNRSCPS